MVRPRRGADFSSGFLDDDVPVAVAGGDRYRLDDPSVVCGLADGDVGYTVYRLPAGQARSRWRAPLGREGRRFGLLTRDPTGRSVVAGIRPGPRTEIRCTPDPRVTAPRPQFRLMADPRRQPRGQVSFALAKRVSLDQTSSGGHHRLSAWRSIASSSESGMSSRTSCAQRQTTAILAAHASASSREATSTTTNPPTTSLVSG